MTYDARQIANWFVQRFKQDGKPLTIMQLLKLTYIAHGWHLEMFQKPLFANKIEAWQYGPVIRDVYNAVPRKDAVVLAPAALADSTEIEPSVEKLLQDVHKIYGHLDAFTLSNLTHVPGGPWDIARKAGGWYAKIPDEAIKKHYEDKRRQATTSQVDA